MSNDIVGLVIGEFVVVVIWILGDFLIHAVCSLSGDFSGLALFNFCMILITAVPVGFLAFLNR